MEKLTIEAIRVNKGISREEAANLLNISIDRYNRLANGQSKLLATEFIKIHEIFEIPYEMIAINN